MTFAILAAGEGSRLAQEGVALPKPLVHIGGEPMIDRLIRIFMSCGASQIVVITNNLTPLTQDHLRMLVGQGIPLQVVVKTTPSSMHSFHELQPLIGKGKFCLTTVDTIFHEDDFRRYIYDFQLSDCDGLMAVTDYVDDEKPLYVSTDQQLRIRGFHDSLPDFQESTVSKAAGVECKYISGGIYCLNDRSFATLDRCIAADMSRMRNFQRQLVCDGLQLRACPFTKILDVDHAGDIAKAEAFLRHE